VSGCTYGIYYGSGHTISGTMSGCTYGIRYGSGCTISGTMSGCTYGVYSGSGHTISGTISGCAYGINYAGARLIGATLGNTTDVVYSGSEQGQYHLVRAYDYGGTAGDTRSWSAGGYGARDATTPAPAFDASHKFTMVDANFWNYHQDDIQAYRDRPLIISVAAKNGATGLTGRARVELIEGPAEDPFITGTPTRQLISSDDTDWHIDRWFVMPTADTTYVIRGCAKHGSGNAYVAWRVEPVETD
jgi:hypothetical protein